MLKSGMSPAGGRAGAPSGAGRCAAGRHEDGPGPWGMPAHGAGTGDAPPILFRLAEKECAVHGGRKRRLGAKRRLWRLFCLKTGVVRIHAAETCHASAECAVPPRNRERIPRIWSLGRIFPGRLTHGLCSSFRAPRFATRSPSLSPGGESKGEGPQPRPFVSLGGVGETGEAPPAADEASLFRGSGAIGGPEKGPGIAMPRRC